MSRPKTTPNGRTTPRRVSPPTPATHASNGTPVVPTGRLAVLKVLVQPTLVLIGEDGSVREVAHPTVEIKGIDWPTWAKTAFDEAALKTLQQTIVPLPVDG